MSTMPNPPDQEHAPPSDTTVGRHRRILYADDMIELRNLMSAVLEHEGYDVETVDGGGEALDRLKQANPGYDLLITDHHMPGTNGLDLVHQARDLHYAGKILVFTSEVSEAIHQQYRQFAVDAILPKPIFPVAFRQVLEALFAAENPDEAGHAPAAHA